MGINLDKMREKLSSLRGEGNSSNDTFWRPEDGDQTIRIVPTADGDPFKEMDGKERSLASVKRARLKEKKNQTLDKTNNERK